MIVDSHRLGAGREAAAIAAVLTERGLGGDSVDLDARLDQFRRDRSQRAVERAQSRGALGVAGGRHRRCTFFGRRTIHRRDAGLRVSRSRRAQSRQRKLCACQRPRRRRRSGLGAGPRALHRGRRIDRHGGERAHPAGRADRAGRHRIALRRPDRKRRRDQLRPQRRWRCGRGASGHLHAITLSEAPIDAVAVGGNRARCWPTA